MGTRCTPHLAVPVLYSDEADFMQKTYKRQTKQKKTHKNIKKKQPKNNKKKSKKQKNKAKTTTIKLTSK
jgi:hypothetical protein